MCSSFEDHVPPLFKTLIDELVAALGGLAGLAATREEYATFFVLDGHEVCWDLDVDDVGAVGVRAKVVHEQVVRVVDEKVERVNHLAVVADQWHFYGLFHYLCDRLLRSLLLLQQLDLHLLFGLFEQELGLADHLLALFQCLLDLARLLQHAHEVAILELLLGLQEKLGAVLRLLVQFFGLELHVDEVGIFQEARELVELLLLQRFQLLVQRVEEVDDALAQLVFQVELFALRDLLPTRNQAARPLVDVLQKVLRRRFQQQDLVVVVAVVRKVAALLAHQLVVQ